MSPDRFSSDSAAAKRLGVSPKALRHYERHGLLEPIRTAAGWRAYGAAEMERAAEIVALRADLEQGEAPKIGEPLRLTRPASEARAALALP